MRVREYIGARYVPIVVGEWDNSKTYEPLMVVIHEGNSYVSRQYVPTGIDIQNEQYWIESANYNAQVDAYRKEVQAFDGRIAANATAIDAEKTRAENAEQTLQDGINTNATKITENKNDIADVRKRATYNERPILVAHQGSATMAPNQTLAAYMAAITYGADALECDPQLTTDGVLVCVHDADTSLVSNHEPILTYSESTWGELESVIVDKPDSAQFFEPQHLMRFNDLCALCNQYGKKIVVDDRGGVATQGLSAYYKAIKAVLDSYNLTDNAYLLANNFASVDAIQSVFPTSTPIFVEGNGNESNFIEARNRGIGIAFNINNADDVRLQQIYQLPADLWTLDNQLATVAVPYNLLTTNNPFMFAKSVSNQDEFTYKTSYTLPVEFSKLSYEMFGFFMYSTIQKETGIYPVHNIQYGVSELVHESDGYNHFLHCMVNDGYKDYKYALNGNKPSGSTWLDSGWQTNESYFVINNVDTEIEPIQFRVKMQYGNYGIAHKNGHVSVNELNLCMASMTDGKIVNGPSHYCCFPNLRFPSGAISIPVLAANTRNWQFQIIDIAADGSQIESSHWEAITTNGITKPASTHDNCVRRFMQLRVVENVLGDADIRNLMEMLPYMFTEKELIK